jgi:hypothetical protein
VLNGADGITTTPSTIAQHHQHHQQQQHHAIPNTITNTNAPADYTATVAADGSIDVATLL